jgi:hypothetical protein
MTGKSGTARRVCHDRIKFTATFDHTFQRSGSCGSHFVRCIAQYQVLSKSLQAKLVKDKCWKSCSRSLIGIVLLAAWEDWAKPPIQILKASSSASFSKQACSSFGARNSGASVKELNLYNDQYWWLSWENYKYQHVGLRTWIWSSTFYAGLLVGSSIAPVLVNMNLDKFIALSSYPWLMLRGIQRYLKLVFDFQARYNFQIHILS